jgi:hypothetical protein
MEVVRKLKFPNNSNSVILISPDEKIADIYSKNSVVPIFESKWAAVSKLHNAYGIFYARTFNIPYLQITRDCPSFYIDRNYRLNFFLNQEKYLTIK